MIFYLWLREYDKYKDWEKGIVMIIKTQDKNWSSYEKPSINV